MIIAHQVSRCMINSHCSLEMIQAFDQLLGVQPQHLYTVQHEWDTRNNMRTIRIKHQNGESLLIEDRPEWIDSENFRGVDQTNPTLLVCRDIVSWLKEKAEANTLRTLQRIKEDRRQIPQGVAEEYVTRISVELHE